MARYINSPGVQINEKDLSLRAAFNPGTNIVVAGFAPQGPNSEPIIITTASDLETVYGIPTTPAERYFYHSCKQILATPGNLTTIRLPYGEGTGVGFSNTYSALFYPMASAASVHYETTEITTNWVEGSTQQDDFAGGSYNPNLLSSTAFRIEDLSSGFSAVYHWGSTGVSSAVRALTSVGTSAIDLGSATSIGEIVTSLATALTSTTTLLVDTGLGDTISVLQSVEGALAVNITSTGLFSHTRTTLGVTQASLSSTGLAIEGSNGKLQFVTWSSSSYSTTILAASAATIATGGSVRVLTQPDTTVELLSSIKSALASVATTSLSGSTLTIAQSGERTVTRTASAFGSLFAEIVSVGKDDANTNYEWIIYPPVHVTLTDTEYSRILRGDYDWAETDAATQEVFVSDDNGIVLKAGFIVLNSLQTTVNELGEGYYLGFADNTGLYKDSPNFESIKHIYSLDSGGNFAQLRTTRLEFALSATTSESNAGIDSISERLEKVGFVGFETDSYQDHLSLGVFRVRRSAADPSLMSLGTSETHLGSLDYNRRQVSPNGGILANGFLEEIVNAGSSVIKTFIHPSVSRAFDWTEGSTVPNSRVTVDPAAKALFPLGTYVTNSFNQEDSKIIGEVPAKLEKVLRLIENPENTLVDVVIDGGLSNVYATTKALEKTIYDDEVYIENPDGLYDHWKSVVDVLHVFAEKTRKDCMTIFDAPRCFFITGKDQKNIDDTNKNFTEDIYNHLRKCIDPFETNFAAVYANWVKMNDAYTGKKFWLPFSSMAAAIYANNDSVAYPWSAPAGLNRGTFDAIDIAFNPNQKQRDRLYEISANPVVFFSGDGFTVMGQKTLQTKPTAFDRINVRRLFLTLERSVQRALKYFVFEPNTDFTRTRLKNVISPLFEYAKNTEGLYDYLIVCDNRNNLPETIDNNELIVDIYLKPVRTAEFILVNFIATRTGQNFSELI